MENIIKLLLNLAYFSTLRKASVVMKLNCGTPYLNAIDAYNLSLCIYFLVLLYLEHLLTQAEM